MTAAYPVPPLLAMQRAVVAMIRSSQGLEGVIGVTEDDLVMGSLGIAAAPLNSVSLARFTPETADGRIDEVVAWFDRLRVPFTWWLGPDSAPPDLGERLVRHGLVREAETIPGMAALLDALPDERPPAGITVERVADEATFRESCRVAVEGFGAPPELAAAIERFAALGFEPANPQRTFVARLDGRPVGTALGIRAGEVLGIFNVATVPDVRGRGVGRAVTLGALRDGVAAGCRMAVLQSSTMGHSVYEQLGFRDFATYELYGHDVCVRPAEPASTRSG
jgi:GNAT superfamily N-acetyltransferase